MFSLELNPILGRNGVRSAQTEGWNPSLLVLSLYRWNTQKGIKGSQYLNWTRYNNIVDVFANKSFECERFVENPLILLCSGWDSFYCQRNCFEYHDINMYLSFVSISIGDWSVLERFSSRQAVDVTNPSSSSLELLLALSSYSCSCK